MSLLAVEKALETILARVPAPTSETVALNEALGRVLVSPVVARHDQPPFNASAMDGYAVRADDVAEGIWLTIVGTAQAGVGMGAAIGPGEAARIFTGAPLPAGADTVIMQEEAVREADRVRFTADARRGHSVRQKGNDFSCGQALLPVGTRLNALHISAAAAANCGTVNVARRPHIDLAATGDELVPPGSPLGPDQIVGSNSLAISALLSPLVGTCADHGIMADDFTSLRAGLAGIFATEPDIVITTGGASVGEHDLVQETLKELGVSLDFWRINMRPGKPLMFGSLGKTLVFGLPGNPVSALVTAIVFVLPAVRRWLGMEQPTLWRLPLAAPTPPNTARRHFMRARLQATSSGLQVEPILQTDSGHTSSLAQADALIVQPEFDQGQAPGTLVDVLPIGQC
ncbi:molybdopterin molybdotransferase MoeA [Devosia sp. PTR5]|uniref:Molybdopterin molybdenumtransferase n=1 Tax=Devosia oryzisoli TaxID=2774138 RepID=A0A927FQY0_9HYPH|nr:gephyrin-like molybdotransferase Glp [Devosia oryzisoli]MBD8064610.1 molybdopterin molybdotransferase MoeA [Devosia oryzisoli]